MVTKSNEPPSRLLATRPSDAPGVDYKEPGCKVRLAGVAEEKRMTYATFSASLELESDGIG